jgi:hypothetical protein
MHNLHKNNQLQQKIKMDTWPTQTQSNQIQPRDAQRNYAKRNQFSNGKNEPNLSPNNALSNCPSPRNRKNETNFPQALAHHAPPATRNVQHTPPPGPRTAAIFYPKNLLLSSTPSNFSAHFLKLSFAFFTTLYHVFQLSNTFRKNQSSFFDEKRGLSHRVSSIQDRVSSTEHPESSIEYREHSCFKNEAPRAEHQASSIEYRGHFRQKQALAPPNSLKSSRPFCRFAKISYPLYRTKRALWQFRQSTNHQSNPHLTL